jgi:hypothetical protein
MVRSCQRGLVTSSDKGPLGAAVAPPGFAAVVAHDFDDGRARPATETLCAGIIESFELSFEMATHMIVPAQNAGT